jgi:D-alanyl-D-alanine carboxypeptidase
VTGPHSNSSRWASIPAGVRPGAEFSYSNTNYVAMGLALEKVTGHSVADLVQQRIAGPLHLKHTCLSGTPEGTAFVGRRGNLVDTTWINSSSEWAAGAMISTADDWARFDSALLFGKLLPPAELNAMRTTVPEDPSAPDDDGYGLDLIKVVSPCGTVWGHDGQVGGYNSVTYTDSTGRRTVDVLTSTAYRLAVPETGAANQGLINAAVCTMLDKPVPAGNAA